MNFFEIALSTRKAVSQNEEYMRHETNKFVGNYFYNSLQDMISFFVRKKNDLREAEQLLKTINNIKHYTYANTDLFFFRLFQ